MSLSKCVPDCAVKYILFQRTAYLYLPKNIFIKILERLSPWSLYKTIVTLESTFRKEKVKNLFIEELNKEYDEIKQFLPQKCSKVLDVGCGVCGIDVLLYRHYSYDESLEFYLLDKTGVTKEIYYGFKKEAAFYNSFEAAEKLLCNNGIQKNQLDCRETGPDFHTSVNA